MMVKPVNRSNYHLKSRSFKNIGSKNTVRNGNGCLDDYFDAGLMDESTKA
jgi:hypothetical protein